MLLNADKAADASRGFQVLYETELHKQEPWAPKVAKLLTTTKTSETFPWAQLLGGYRRWIGPALKNNVAVQNITFTPEDWRFDVIMPKKAVDDDATGIFSDQFAQMGIEAGNLDNDLVAEALKEGYSASGKCGPCYDGGAFFSAAHTDSAEHSQDNTGTDILDSDALDAALLKMRAIVAVNGDPIPFVFTTLVVGQGSVAMAETLRDAPNIGVNWNKWFHKFEVVYSPLIDGNDWFMLDLSKGIKPIALLTRQEPDFNAITSPDAECVKERNEYEYYSYARKVAGYLYWQLAFGSTGNGT